MHKIETTTGLVHFLNIIWIHISYHFSDIDTTPHLQKQMEAQSTFNLHPVQFQLSALPTIQSLRYVFSGSSSEIIDVGEIFRMMEDLSQNELQQFWSIMSHIHSCDVRDIQDYCYRLQHTISWESSGSQEGHRQKSNQMVAEKVLKTKALVKSALIQVVRDFNVRVKEQICDKELCFLVNKTVEEDKTQQFWNKVANLVPSKTKKQLYDFYHTSFSKALFDSQISIEDRKMIEQLNAEHPNAKPAALVQVFLDKSGRNIMKHNVIMCFVNIRRYASRLAK
ncbi:Hypothetical_protein [Hexamita inflata]|uniref:Hypothetical_protein n=1 Tax=Hexamita inflata TaxID=28002 RepID=A0AA86REZ7_9EUKA|nr:Hypothetical protein HINF_LOCUS64879 [Hexamita inflata]